MLTQDTYKEAHLQFGIDEVYIHAGLDFNILKKLQQRAEFTFDTNDTIVQKNVGCDMVFIFHKRMPSKNFIYRFLEFLKNHPSQELDFKRLYTLLNEEELFEAIKTKKFVLVSYRDISATL